MHDHDEPKAPASTDGSAPDTAQDTAPEAGDGWRAFQEDCHDAGKTVRAVGIEAGAAALAEKGAVAGADLAARGLEAGGHLAQEGRP